MEVVWPRWRLVCRGRWVCMGDGLPWWWMGLSSVTGVGKSAWMFQGGWMPPPLGPSQCLFSVYVHCKVEGCLSSLWSSILSLVTSVTSSLRHWQSSSVVLCSSASAVCFLLVILSSYPSKAHVYHHVCFSVWEREVLLRIRCSC